MRSRKAVITGLGIISPLGGNVAENWAGLKSGETGIGSYAGDNRPPGFQYAGKVHGIDPSSGAPRGMSREIRFLNRSSRLGLIASKEAVAQSGGSLEGVPPHRRSLYVGSGDYTMVGYEFMHSPVRRAADPHFRHIDRKTLNEACLREVNPFFLLESMHNNLFSLLSAWFDFQGPNATLGDLSPCGAQAVQLACRAIAVDEADAALAVGCSSWVSDILLYELQGLGLLSGCKKGPASFRPFDRRRDGFIPGEGGAAILLEEAGRARSRGATVLGSIEGCGEGIDFGGDGFGLPMKIGRRSGETAMREAGCRPADLGFYLSHGSATVKGDRSELSAVRALLGGDATGVPVCGMKPYTGHMGAASDVVEIVLGIMGLKEGLAPATLNFERTDKEFSELRISGKHHAHGKRHFLAMSYGIGGQSAALVVKAP